MWYNETIMELETRAKMFERYCPPSYKYHPKPTCLHREGQLNEWLTPKERADVYERDNYTCQRCSYQTHKKKKLHAHHIISKRDGGDHAPANLVTVCSSCHHYIHSRIISPVDYLPETRLKDFLESYPQASMYMELINIRRVIAMYEAKARSIELDINSYTV